VATAAPALVRAHLSRPLYLTLARRATIARIAAIEAACADYLATATTATFDNANDWFHLASSVAAGNPDYMLLVAVPAQVQREVIHALPLEH
jgi:DNA-binding GntR family transcriptional regulator